MRFDNLSKQKEEARLSLLSPQLNIREDYSLEIQRSSVMRIMNSKKWKNLLIFNALCESISYFIMMVYLWTFIQQLSGDITTLARFVATFAAGELIGQLLWGIMYTQASMKVSMIISILIGMIGSILFSYAGQYVLVDQSTGLWFIWWGRLLQGFWIGSSSIIKQAYVAEVLPKEQNNHIITSMYYAYIGGMSLGPMIGALLINLDFTLFSLKIDEHTSIGYFLTILTFVLLILAVILFEEVPKQFRRSALPKYSPQNVEGAQSMQGYQTSGVHEGHQYLQQLLLSNQSDIYFQNYFQKNESFSNSESHLYNYRISDNKSLIQIANLSEDEIKALYSLSPNFGGVFITLIILAVQNNSLSIIETLVTPIITDTTAIYTDNLSFSVQYAAMLFIVMGGVCIFSFLIFRKLFNQQNINKISDRSFVFTTLMIGLLGSLIVIDYKRRTLYPIQLFLGFSLIMISFAIGKQVTNNMFAKLIGNQIHRSYLTYSLLVVALARILFPFMNIGLIEKGIYLVFGVASGLYILSILLMTLCINSLAPHYSYLIEKQKEIILKGLSNKDLKILDTPEYQGLPMPTNNQKVTRYN